MTTSPKLEPSSRSTPIDAAESALIEQLAERLSQTLPLLIVSPPRSASTAFARALNGHSSVNRYFHEPCGLYSYENTSAATILDELDDLSTGGLIKEMTFQFRELLVAECFFRNCASPTIFLARSPRLTIESRIRMVLLDLIQTDSTSQADIALAQAAIDAKDYSAVDALLTEEIFPLYRTGWSDLAQQLELCRKLEIDYVIVEPSRFRSQPEETLKALCPRLGLTFEPGMLSWTPRKELPEGALERHAIWYARVDASSGVQPPAEQILPLDRFPARFRPHLREALATYEQALSDPRCL